MIKKALLIKNNLVINAIVLGDNYIPEYGVEVLEITSDIPAWIGWTRNEDGTWEPPYQPEIIEELEESDTI